MEIFSQFFTDKPMFKSSNYSQDDIRIRYFGHACVLLQTKDCNILLDPFISYAYDNDLKRFSFIDLPDNIDLVCITHSHQDHFHLETLLHIRHKVKLIIVPQNAVGSICP